VDVQGNGGGFFGVDQVAVHGDDFEGVVADGQILVFDAAFVGSLPGVFVALEPVAVEHGFGTSFEAHGAVLERD